MFLGNINNGFSTVTVVCLSLVCSSRKATNSQAQHGPQTENLADLLNTRQPQIDIKALLADAMWIYVCGMLADTQLTCDCVLLVKRCLRIMNSSACVSAQTNNLIHFLNVIRRPA